MGVIIMFIMLLLGTIIIIATQSIMIFLGLSFVIVSIIAGLLEMPRLHIVGIIIGLVFLYILFKKRR